MVRHSQRVWMIDLSSRSNHENSLKYSYDNLLLLPLYLLARSPQKLIPAYLLTCLLTYLSIRIDSMTFSFFRMLSFSSIVLISINILTNLFISIPYYIHHHSLTCSIIPTSHTYFLHHSNLTGYLSC